MKEVIVVLVVLLLLIVFYFKQSELLTGVSDMGIIGDGLSNNYDSGADLRFATELTSTDEQPYSTPYVKDVLAVNSLLNQNQERFSSNTSKERMTQGGSGDLGHMYMCPCSKCNFAFAKEHLVGNGTFPAFFETSRAFGDYREADREKYFGIV